MRRFAAVAGRPPDWRDLAAGGPMFATELWLDAMRGRIPGADFTFVLREPGKTVLALYGTVLAGAERNEVFGLPYILTGDARDLPLAEDSLAARASWRVPPPESWYPHLVVMLPGYECHPIGPLAGDPDALSELTGAVVAWARDQGLRLVAFLYTPPSTAALQEALASRGFSRIPLAYTCELALTGEGFDDYLAALPRKRRTEARRELRRLTQAGVVVRAVRVTRVPEDVVGLKCGHSAKYNGVPADRAKVRARLEGLCAESGLLVRAELEGTLVGYGLFIEHAGVWYCVSTAMDYGRHQARHAYFATVFYEPVRLAYSAGVRRLHYGQGSWRAKLSRGCRAVELPGWVLALDPRLAPVVADSARTTVLAP
ncbi:hypothetical protein GCM10022226_42030 [Sphaerisporangium flaviroseum]|uniref:GNAT family N-acetyltransferase n=1 Tax=Sphaerisporangium flaviroseum TaxID=509199 RepID=A0ABP7IF64_9ACTN